MFKINSSHRSKDFWLRSNVNWSKLLLSYFMTVVLTKNQFTFAEGLIIVKWYREITSSSYQSFAVLLTQKLFKRQSHTKWSNTQKIHLLLQKYLSVFDHFVGLALKGLMTFFAGVIFKLFLSKKDRSSSYILSCSKFCILSTQLKFICSKSKIEALECEKDVKHV